MGLGSKTRASLLVGASAFALFACSDTDIESPGIPVVSPPTTPTTPTTPTADVNLPGSANCAADTPLSNVTVSGQTVNGCTISAFSGTLDLDSNTTYILNGKVEVGTDGDNSILNIPAGVTVAAATTADYLVVPRGSQINAIGSASQPIVFTSLDDVLGNAQPTDRQQWGGVVINGFAPINACEDATGARDTTVTGGSAACTKQGEGDSGLYGGDNAADDSGELRYVQVLYAGFRASGTNELNGIAFQGVGTGTDINFVQVYNNEDDGIEFFGGTADAKYFVLNGNGDDSLDWTDGWSGSAQYIIIDHATDDGDNGFEGDNLGGAEDATPISDPSISNFTILGESNTDIGMNLKAGTAGTYINGIVAGMGESGIDVDGAVAFGRIGAAGTAADPDLRVDAVLFDNPVNFANDGDGDEDALFGAEGFNLADIPNTLVDTFFPGGNELSVPVVTASAIDPELNDETFIGAFGPTENLASNWATGWTFSLLPSAAPASCPTGTTDSGMFIDDNTRAVVEEKRICDIAAFSGTVRLTDGDELIYRLNGQVRVGVDLGADPASPRAGGSEGRLVIDEGVTVFAATTADFLTVSRGSQIFANGTESDPVIFTSDEAVNGTAVATDRQQWGGLVVNGRAPINACEDSTGSFDPLVTGGTTACEKQGEGDSGLFGGASANESSGRLRYVRVEYAGFRASGTNELNGIAFQGVGDDTEIEFIQVTNNEDDGIEFFGGTADAKYFVLTGNGDDSLDWTDGWDGSAQYIIIHHASDDGDNGFEGDNLGGAEDATPISDPTISNFTIVGRSNTDIGMNLKAGTAGTYVNGVVTDMGESGIDIDGAVSFGRIGAAGTAADPDLRVDAVLFGDNLVDFANDGDGNEETELSAFTLSTASSNISGTFSFYPADATAGDTVTGYNPGANELALASDVVNANAIDPQVEATTYVGAVEDASDAWYQGWTLQIQ